MNLKIKTKEEFEKILIERDGDPKRFLEFKNCSFHFDIEIEHALVEINCTDCIFENSLKINSTIHGNSIFKNCEFKEKVDFSDCLFSKKARFHNSNFRDQVKFDNTRFKDLADFWSSIFCEQIIFFKTDFFGTTVFSATTFKKNVLFTYTLVKAELIFRGTIFNSGLDLSLMILTGSVNVFDIKLSNYSSVENFQNEGDYEYSISNLGLIPHKNKRETFRILKKELKSQGNSIDSMTFMTLEKKALQEQLMSDYKSTSNKIKNMQDRFILGLGALSNGHGEFWTKGVVFTFSIGIILFYLSVLATEKYQFSISFSGMSINDFHDCLERFFTFMLPTHKIEYLDKFKPTWAFYILDMIGRIFVAFGIYQTIFAFRKYHSK